MSPAALVVVTDDSSSEAFARALARVVKTVPSEVAVAAVSSRSPSLPASLARRVRRVRVRSAADVTPAADGLLAHPALAVVVSSRCRVSAHWWDSVRAAAAGLDGVLGVLDEIGSLTVKPAGAVPGTAPRVPLVGITGVEVGAVAVSSSDAHAPLPVKISATMIVKDEEAVLEECLTALAPWVDEIVVYDTGSTDSTVEIAQRCGARVVRGYWDDDFGAARNRSLEHCTHDWSFCVDADEVVTGGAAEVRARLARTSANILEVIVESTSWTGATSGDRIRSSRFFRRSQVAWSGSLHEQLVARPGSTARRGPDPLPCVLVHSGYQMTAVVEKDKAARNLAISSKVAAGTSPDDSDYVTAWTNHGRTLIVAGRLADGVEALTRVLDAGAQGPDVVLAGRCAVPALSQLGRLDEIERWMSALEGLEAAGTLANWRAQLALARGDLRGARAALTSIGPTTDAWGLPHDPAALAMTRIRTDMLDGELAAAVAAMQEQVAATPERVAIALVVELAGRSGKLLDDFIRSSPGVLLDRSLREAVGPLAPGAAHAWLTAWCAVHPEDPRPVVAGCVMAPRSTLEVMLQWSAAARHHGLAHLCPLRAYAQDERSDPASRCLAWALLAELFDDHDAVGAWQAALTAVPEEQLAALGAQLEELAPELLAAVTS